MEYVVNWKGEITISGATIAAVIVLFLLVVGISFFSILCMVAALESQRSEILHISSYNHSLLALINEAREFDTRLSSTDFQDQLVSIRQSYSAASAPACDASILHIIVDFFYTPAILVAFGMFANVLLAIVCMRRSVDWQYVRRIRRIVMATAIYWAVVASITAYYAFEAANILTG